MILIMKRDDQVCIRLSGTLRQHLEDEALASGRSLSNLIRQILINHTADRVASTSQREAA
jgi:hypothetical protein